MITYTQGDLLDAEEPVIVHGCNNKGVMRSGVAKVIRAKWPSAYRAYKQAPRLVTGMIIPVYTDGKWIINAITQDGYGKDGRKYVLYDGMVTCFRAVNEFCDDANITSIAIPKIGSDLGGGKWAIIEQIINSEMTSADVKVYVL